MSACFVAGAAGDWEDEKEEKGRLAAETWELTNMWVKYGPLRSPYTC